MDEQSKLKLQMIMKRRIPDMSHIKPPKEHAVYAMIRNLHAAAGTKADKSPK
ncbi:MAG: hypothetical protein V4702_03060 [Patescibacteria group bacterium]